MCSQWHQFEEVLDKACAADRAGRGNRVILRRGAGGPFPKRRHRRTGTPAGNGPVFASNWGQIAASRSYFASPELFAHFWSLAVEEQFYVVWPVVVAGLLASLGAKRLKAISAVFFAVALVSMAGMLALYTPGQDPTRVYYGTDTHAFSLLIGAALAAWLVRASKSGDAWGTRGGRGRGQWLGGAVEVAGFVGFVALLAAMRDDAPVAYRGGLFVAALCAAAMIHGAIRKNPVIWTVFTLRPLRHLGAISFSLYLWHWVVFVIAREALGPGIVAGIVALGLSLGLAELSYRFVEEPFRKMGYVGVAHPLFPAQASGIWRGAAAGGVAIAVAFSAGTAVASAPKMTALEADLLAVQRQREAQLEAQRAAAAQAAQKAADEQARRDELNGPNITAIGDSVILASSEALQAEFPGIYLDAAVSRHYESVPAILDELDASGLIRNYVVLGFGTNGPSNGAGDAELLDRIIGKIGAGRTIAIVLPYGDRWYMSDAQQEVLEAARTYDNVYIADWCTRAGQDASILRDDLIHPDPPGAAVYAAEVRTALEQSVSGAKVIPSTCSA